MDDATKTRTRRQRTEEPPDDGTAASSDGARPSRVSLVDVDDRLASLRASVPPPRRSQPAAAPKAAPSPAPVRDEPSPQADEEPVPAVRRVPAPEPEARDPAASFAPPIVPVAPPARTQSALRRPPPVEPIAVVMDGPTFEIDRPARKADAWMPPPPDGGTRPSRHIEAVTRPPSGQSLAFDFPIDETPEEAEEPPEAEIEDEAVEASAKGARGSARPSRVEAARAMRQALGRLSAVRSRPSDAPEVPDGMCEVLEEEVTEAWMTEPDPGGAAPRPDAGDAAADGDAIDADIDSAIAELTGEPPPRK